ncbi:MAG: CBS domain-containing protein [Vicinamibacterales bacterium]|nr:CBS domain-containing protein [Vicinamibacterales bacterium]
MRVHEIMTAPAVTCGPHDSLAAAARLMWDYDCGILPIVDPHGRVTGVITDRDITIAVASRPYHASEIPVNSVSTGRVYGVDPTDHVEAALELMGAKHVRRLPVLDAAGTLKGMLSLSDLAKHAGRKGLRAVTVMATLKRLAAPTPADAM